MEHKKKPTCLATRVVAESRLFYIEEMDLRFSNGVERVYERIRGRAKGSIIVVPLLTDDTVLLIREYSGGVDRYELALPKGIWEAEEDLVEATNRELMEEIGYGARDIQFLKTLTLSPGYMAAETQLLVARDLYPKSLLGDEPEAIEVVPWSLHDLDGLLQQKDCSEARTIAALFMVRDWLKNQSKEGKQQ